MMLGIISLAAYDSASENSKFPETAPTAYGSKEAAESDSIFTIHNDAKPTNSQGKQSKITNGFAGADSEKYGDKNQEKHC